MICVEPINIGSFLGQPERDCKCSDMGLDGGGATATVSQGRICSNKFTCCHTEREAADQTFYITKSQYTDTGPTSPSADPIMQST